MEIQKLHVKGDDKIKTSARKKHIQEKLWNDMGL